MFFKRRLALAVLAIAWQTCPVARAAEPVAGDFDSGGVTIHYVEAGRGQPVVLVHGLHASAAANWIRPGVFEELAKDHRVIALDLRGHGKSGKPADEKAYGVELVEDVVRLLDHLKIDKAHVVGYSLGGMITVKLLTKHPERVLSATVGGMGWLREGSRLQEFWEKREAPEGRRTPEELIRSIGDLAVTRDELAKIKVPVEIVVGDRDPVKRLYIAPLRLVRPDWPIVEIPDAGHINRILRPEFREAIREGIGKSERGK
jgi:pimeloyl-ACP methyl ester carboxylesterase